MNTKTGLSFARFAQTILIVFILSILGFVSAEANVKGQIGTIDSPFFGNPAVSQSVIEGDGVVPGGPGFMMISPLAFKPTFSTYQWAYSGVGLYNPSTTSNSDFVVGLTLPHNATLTKLTLYYKDDSAQNINVFLYKANGLGAATYISYLVSSGAVPAFRYMSTTEISQPVVDNQNYSYFLEVLFPINVGESIVLTNVRIDYEYTTVAPVIMK